MAQKAANATKTMIERAFREQAEKGLSASLLRDQVQQRNLGPLGNTGQGYTPDPDATTRVDVRKNSTGSVYSRRRLNLIEGTNVTLTVADDSGNEEVDITIAASGGGSLTIEEVDGSPTVSASKLVLPNGTLGVVGTVATYTPAGGGSGTPIFVQHKVATSTATSVTMDAAPTVGNRIILFSNSTSGQITSVACTNVTWTQVMTFTGVAAYYAIWVGIVGASPSSVISCSIPGTFNTMIAVETTEALTPTLGQSATSTSTAGATMAATTAGHFVVACSGCDNTSITGMGSLSVPHSGVTINVASLIMGYSQGYTTFASIYAGGQGAVLLAEIT